jgi:hypothetical protein
LSEPELEHASAVAALANSRAARDIGRPVIVGIAGLRASTEASGAAAAPQNGHAASLARMWRAHDAQGRSKGIT